MADEKLGYQDGNFALHLLLKFDRLLIVLNAQKFHIYKVKKYLVRFSAIIKVKKI